jgi:gamma-glutamylcyclotransferase (GGCT)/AIG2-like uncharacterized protein YtfP
VGSEIKNAAPCSGYRLFVYGTLQNPYYLSLVIGREADVVPAVLSNYEKVVSHLSFPFIVPRKGGVVVGRLVEGLNDAELERTDRYESEGQMYVREPVTVTSNDEQVEAFTYVAGPELLAERIPEGLTITNRITEFLRDFIEDSVESEKAGSDLVAALTLRAKRELLGGAVEDLLRELYDHPATPSFIVKQALSDDVPSLAWLKKSPEAVPYADNYIQLIVKTVIHNQLEERIREDFRGVVQVDDKYYERTVSSLVALSYISDNLGTLKQMAESLGVYAYNPDMEYIDYTVGAIFLADGLYNNENIKPYVERIRDGRNPGAVPLGGEVEFSNIGHCSVKAEVGADPEFDCFYYFNDFDLINRMWKFGGHIDNHKFITPDRGRVRGFLEFSFGRYKILGDLSKPTTKDPWMLSELANATVAFAEIRPHSFHISLQIMGSRPFKPLEGIESLICLLLLGGDINPDDGGIWREQRLFKREIYSEYQGVSFSRFNEHKTRPDDENPAKVVEFTFPRLFHEHSYVDLIMALKGYQLSYNPAPLIPPEDCDYAEYHKELEETLLDWANNPTAPSDSSIGGFVEKVEQGLDYETRVFAGHDAKFAGRWLGEIEKKLRNYSEFIRSGGEKWLREM